MICTNTVLKKTLHWPFILPSSGNRTNIGIPGPSPGAAGGFATNLVINDTPPTTTDATDPFTTTIQSINNAQQRVQVPIPSGGGRLRGIAVAPDSVIDSCDVSLQGLNDEGNRFRISPGNPLIGDFGTDIAQLFLNVTIPNPLPDLQLDSPGKFAVWDNSNITPSGGGTFASFPLRLEFMYGDVLQLRDAVIRPPMTAAARCIITSAAGVVHFLVGVCGRKKVKLTVIPGSATASVTVVSNVPKPSNVSGSILWASQQLSVLATVGVPTAKEFDLTTGVNAFAPYDTLDIAVTDSAVGPNSHYITLRAWD